MDRFGGRQLPYRVEDARLLTGQGRFTGNLTLPGQTYLAVVRSPHAHATIEQIDLSAAREMPGVLAAWTGDDLARAGVGAMPFAPMFKRPDGAPMSAPPRRLLALERVRYVGEPVAAIVAESRAAAMDAAEAVLVDYVELPAVVDVRDATAPDAPTIWPDAPGNIVAEMRHGDRAGADRAFAQAAHVIRLDLINQRLVANPMEPRTVVAEFDAATGRITLHGGFQNPTAMRQMLSEHVLKIPADKVRVLVRDIGGGFGMKATPNAEDALAAYAAMRLERPVRWGGERAEDFLSAVHGRDHATHAELALDRDGRILALRVDTLANVGTYLGPSSTLIPLALGPKVITGVYDVPVVDMRVRAVLTNTATVSAYRGAGRPEAIYLIERIMDEAAARLGLDPVAFRRRNVVPAAKMPYKNALGEIYDSGDFARMLDHACEAADWTGFPARREAARARGQLLGRGVSLFIEWTGAYQFTEKVDLRVQADGKIVVHSATQAMGQGLETAYTQLFAQRLGIPPERVVIVQGDTDLVAGFGSMASRSLYVGGSAVAAGAEMLIEHGKSLAAEFLEAAVADIEYAEGRFVIAGTDRSIDWSALASGQSGGAIELAHTNTVAGSTWPNGCHVCEIEIDPETGVSRIVRYTTCDDVGTAINPMLVTGQIHGGIVQGAGQALLERCVYDRGSGQLLTGSFNDYCMPRADDFPSFATLIDESVPCATNPLGAKGAGESGTVGATPAVMNAVMDALRPLGVTHLDMPATPLAIWEAIQQGRKNKSQRHSVE